MGGCAGSCTCRRKVERARANLARYVSSNLIEDLAAVDEPFGPVRTQEVAVLFVDIVGFTALCEGMAPVAVVAMLRDFHRHMATCVFEHGGTLDKFIGDCVMATFGTPRPSPRDATNALACARAMLVTLERWNGERTASGRIALQAGIGLHFGPVVLGDIGDERRLEFAVLGDTVNIASRLEALTRSLGTSLAASQALVDRVIAQSGEQALAGMSRHAPVAVRGRNRDRGSLDTADQHRALKTTPLLPPVKPRQIVIGRLAFGGPREHYARVAALNNGPVQDNGSQSPELAASHS